MAGDEITAIDGQPIEAWTDVSAAIASAEGGQIIMTVQRDGRTLEAAVTPEQTQDGAYLIGITSRVSHNPFRAVAEGAKSTWNITVSMFQTLSQLFTGQLGADSLSGPVGMVQMVSQTTPIWLVVLWIFNGSYMYQSCHNKYAPAAGPRRRKDNICYHIHDNRTAGKPESRRHRAFCRDHAPFWTHGLCYIQRYNKDIRIGGKLWTPDRLDAAMY